MKNTGFDDYRLIEIYHIDIFKRKQSTYYGMTIPQNDNAVELYLNGKLRRRQGSSNKNYYLKIKLIYLF